MKNITRFLLAILLAGAAVTIGLTQHAIATARTEQVTLKSASEEAQRLAEQNKDMEQLRAEGSEVEKLREQNKELPKLRNEVRQLRRRAEELAKLQTENQRLQAQQNGAAESLPPGFITRTSLVDAGLGTPEATVQTFFWAQCQGNLERMSDCTMRGRDGLNQNLEWQRKQVAKQIAAFTGYRIARRQDISPDEVELTLEAKVGGMPLPMKLKRINNEWKLD